MHTPGPWRAARAPHSNDYTHSIEARDGHIASIARHSTDVALCPQAEANARLIAHAPDLAGAFCALVNWVQNIGGWEAPCWQRAHRILAHATGLATPAPSPPPATTRKLLDKTGCAHRWNEHAELSLLFDFLDREIRVHSTLGTRLQTYLEAAASWSATRCEIPAPPASPVTVTERKYAAARRSRQRQQDALPLFSVLVAERQPPIEQPMRDRITAWDRSEQEWRDKRAHDWRRARHSLATYDPTTLSTLLRYWNEHRWLPGDPSYLLDVLHGFRTDRLIHANGIVRPARRSRPVATR